MRRTATALALAVLAGATATGAAVAAPPAISVAGFVGQVVPTAAGVRLYGVIGRVGLPSPPVAVVDRATGRVVAESAVPVAAAAVVPDGRGGAWVLGARRLVRLDQFGKSLAGVVDPLARAPLVRSGGVIAHRGRARGSVVARDARTGAVLWRDDFGTASLVAAGGDVLALRDAAGVTLVDARTGRAPTAGVRTVVGAARAVAVDGTTLVLGAGGAVRWLDRATGRLTAQATLDMPDRGDEPRLGVLGIAIAGGRTWVVGDFVGVGGERRAGIAAFADGQLLPQGRGIARRGRWPRAVVADSRGALALGGDEQPLVVAVGLDGAERELLRGTTEAPVALAPLGRRALVLVPQGVPLTSTPAGLVTDVDLRRQYVVAHGAQVGGDGLSAVTTLPLPAGRAWVATTQFTEIGKTTVRLVDRAGRTLLRLPPLVGEEAGLVGDRRRVALALLDESIVGWRLVTLDLGAARPRWRTVGTCRSCAGPLEPLALRGSLILYRDGDALVAVDAARRAERFRTALGSRPVFAAIQGRRALVLPAARSGRSSLRAVDLATGRARPWGPAFAVRVGPGLVAGRLARLVPVGERVLICGAFDRVGQAPRRNLALLAAGGSVLPWRRDVPACSDVAVGHGRLVVVGDPFGPSVPIAVMPAPPAA